MSKFNELAEKRTSSDEEKESDSGIIDVDLLGEELVEYFFESQFQENCQPGAGDVTLDRLVEIAGRVPSDIFREILLKYSILNHVVGESYVTLGMVEWLLGRAPAAAHNVQCRGLSFLSHRLGAGSLPLHVACFNADCPVSVVRLLLERNPAAIESRWEEGFGLPLHCYVARVCRWEVEGEDEEGNYSESHPSLPSGELDYDVMNVLVAAYPEALIESCKGRTPLSFCSRGVIRHWNLCRY